MKVTSGHVDATVVRRFEITEGHPVVGMAYATTPKQVRIERGIITYTQKDGEWAVRSYSSVTISGTVLRKDGTLSKNDHKRYPADVYRFNGPTDLTEKLTEEYQWLAPIIDLLRPVGELMMMTLNETEVNG